MGKQYASMLADTLLFTYQMNSDMHKMKHVVDLVEVLKLYNIDLIESDSEDTDFADRCARKIPSKTPGIERRISK